MTSLRSQFNRQIKIIAKENGFLKNKAPYTPEIYFRTTDELLQVFEFNVYSFGGADIFFSSLPIRGKITKNSLECAEYPIILSNIAKIPSGCFEYNRKSEESIIFCAQTCVELFEKYILTFFNSATTCESALKSISNMEYDAYNISPDIEHSEYNAALYMRIDKLYMALNTKNTEIALECCYAWIEHYKHHLERKDISQDGIKEIQLGITKYERYIQMLNEENYVFFDELLDSLEENSRAIISKVLSTKRRK